MQFADCFMDIFVYVAYFSKTAASVQPPFEQVKSDIQRLMAASEEKRGKGEFPMEDFNLARFAVCALVDEVVLASKWNEKNLWLREQLQGLYYQTSDAGELFFEKLNSIGAHQNHVREVYYFCLALGFTGRFCNEGDDYLLEQLKTSNLKLLTGTSLGIPSLDKEELFPLGHAPDHGEEMPVSPGRGLSLFTLICFAGPLVIFCGLFLIYYFILSSVGQNIITTVG